MVDEFCHILNEVTGGVCLAFVLLLVGSLWFLCGSVEVGGPNCRHMLLGLRFASVVVVVLLVLFVGCGRCWIGWMFLYLVVTHGPIHQVVVGGVFSRCVGFVVGVWRLVIVLFLWVCGGISIC